MIMGMGNSYGLGLRRSFRLVGHPPFGRFIPRGAVVGAARGVEGAGRSAPVTQSK
jgi:hypothetical protein